MRAELLEKYKKKMEFMEICRAVADVSLQKIRMTSFMSEKQSIFKISCLAVRIWNAIEKVEY